MSKPTKEKMLEKLEEWFKVYWEYPKGLSPGWTHQELHDKYAESNEIFLALHALIENSDKGPEVDEGLIHAAARAIIQALCREYVPSKEGISMSGVIGDVIKEMFKVLGIRVKEGK